MGIREAADGLDPADLSPRSASLRGMVLSHGEWLRHNNYRERLRYQWREFFRDWDVLICPQSAATAFPHDHSSMSERTITVNGKERDYFEQLFWAGLVTVAYLPSTVFPTGLSASGLPIGLQAVGPEFGDLQTIEFARLFAQEFGGFQPPPAFA